MNLTAANRLSAAVASICATFAVLFAVASLADKPLFPADVRIANEQIVLAVEADHSRP